MKLWPARAGGPAAVALLALAAGLWLGGVMAPRWRAEAQAARWAPARTAPQTVIAAEPQLPAAGDPAVRAADLLALALQHGLRVERAQQRADAGPVPRLQLVMLAHGRYGDLRAFIEAAWLADAALALDRLQWRRASDTADDMAAEVHWTVFATKPAP